MRANQHNLRRRTPNLCFDIVASEALQLIAVAPRNQTRPRKRILDELRGGIELRIARHVSLADFAAKDSHVGDQFVTQFDFGR